MTIMSYADLKGLEHVYLEDSYVLNIQASPNTVEIKLVAVLTEQHPSYSVPRAGEQYCFRDATLQFTNVQHLIWDERTLRAYTDRNGTVDYGNIDEFTFSGQRYQLNGDWGSLTIESAPPVFSINDHTRTNAIQS